MQIKLLIIDLKLLHINLNMISLWEKTIIMKEYYATVICSLSPIEDAECTSESKAYWADSPKEARRLTLEDFGKEVSQGICKIGVYKIGE